MTEAMRITIVVPALNEAAGIGACLHALQPLRGRGHELIVVDGGSTDTTAALASEQADRVVQAPRGRARQMNHGAALAQGGLLWFVHADTRVPEEADALILDALSGAPWGRFDIHLSGRGPLLRVVEALVNLRSRVSGIATGDQGIFVRREAFEAVGGFPDIPLMEDVAIGRLLKRLARPRCLRAHLTTSSRRWETRGTLKTVWLMWRLRLAYALGADARDLARRYRV
jgi:rSAM/selenodomain-associated transferase 2